MAAAVMAVGGLPLLSFVAPTAPAAATPATDGNPDLAGSCGLDVTLVLDNSASIDASEATQVRASAQLFANALAGTPSRLKTVVFSSRAQGVSAAGTLTSNLNNIVFRDPSLYTAPTSGAGSGGTNWDDGLETVRRSNGGPGDLVVVITDGDPTYRNAVAPDGHLNDGSHALAGDGSTIGQVANLTPAIYEADQLKAAGAHMFGIGIGFTQPASEQRLNDITGDEELTIAGGVPTPSFGTGDYIVTPSFSDLQNVVKSFATELCGDSINVTKFLQKADGTTAQAGAADPWTYSATLTPAPEYWNSPPGATGATAVQTTDDSGGVSFVWDRGSTADDHVVDLAEVPQAGWVYNGARCVENNLDGTSTPLFDTVGTNAAGSMGNIADLLDLTVHWNKAVNCQVYNRQLRTSTIQVAKATVPAGLAGDFDFALASGGPTIDTISGLSHGETGTFDPVPAGTYSITESPVSGWTNSAKVCDNLGTPAVETDPAGNLVVGEGQSWRCTFTNTAQNGSIKVIKNTVGADGGFLFSSNVPGLGNFGLTTSGGTASTATVSVPVGTYTVTEASPSPWSLTGATCTGGDSPSSINVGPGEAVTCTFTNTAPAPSIRVVKTAGVTSVLELGGPVTYTVNVINTSVEPVTVTGVSDSIDGGPALDLTATGGPITATDCDDLVGDTLAIGATGTCTFTAQVSGLGNTTETDVVTATAEDSDHNVATDHDDASVAIVGVAPTLSVTKTPSVPAITEPGGPVTYTVAITNTGAEPVTMDGLHDVIEGGAPIDVTQVAGKVTATTCGSLAGSSLAAGATVTCNYTIQHSGHSADTPDGFIDDVVTASGHDDDGPVDASAPAKVAILDAPPAVTVTKTASPATVAETAPGQTRAITYTVSIHNDAPEAATIDSIVDSVEGGPANPVAGTCDDLVGTTISAGATVTCTFSASVSGKGGDVLDDVVTVNVSDNEGNHAHDDDPASVTFTDVPSSIQVTKTASATSIPEPGGNITYTVDVKNTSLTDVVTIGSVTDSVDGGPNVPLAGTCGALVGTTLNPNATATCSFTLPVSGNAGDVVGDVVIVSGTDDEGGPVSDDDDASVAITDLPSQLVVEKVADVASLPEPGGTVTYTVTITNPSVADAITLDSITDSVNGAPAFAVDGTCDDLVGTTLAPSSTVSCTFTYPIANAHTGDDFDDTVVVSGTDDDDHPVSAHGSESVVITDTASSLSVTKEAGVASVPEPGGPVTYTVTITNTSEVDTIAIDSIVDSVEGGPAAAVDGTCDDLVGTVLDPGQEVTCEFTQAVSGDAGDTIDDRVTVSGTDDDENPVSAQADETVDVTDVKPSIGVVKTADPTSVAETGPGQTRTVTYSVAITNTGTAEAVTLNDLVDQVDGLPAVPVGGTCAALLGTSIDPGQTVNCTFTAQVSGDAGGHVTDTVTATAYDNEENQATAADDATVTFTDLGSSLSVTKTADVASVPEPGGPVTYTVDITNTSVADSVTIDSITDAVGGGLPFPVDGTCDDLVGTTLAAGASTSCTFTVTVSGTPGTSVGDTVVVSGTDDDNAPVSDDGSESVDITDVGSSLSVTKTANVDSVTEPGGNVTYTVAIHNTSTTDAITIGAITDSVDGGAATAVAGTCDDLVGTTLAAGASTTCTFTVPVTGDAGDTVSDTVTVSGTDDDQQPVSAEGSETVDVTDVAPTITVTKTATPSSVDETGPGQSHTVSYLVTIHNDSPEAVTIGSIVDSVEGGPATGVAGTCDDLIGTSLAAQTGTSCTFTAEVSGDAGDTVDDVVTVTVSDNEQNQGTDSDDASVAIVDLPSSLVVSKTAEVGSVPEPGGTVTYTVGITNTSVADSVTIGSIVDSVGGGAATPVAGTCDDLIGTTLAPGASTSCTFTVAVTGDAGDTVADTVTVSGTDDDEAPVSAEGSESVDITDVASSLTVTKAADPATVPENGGPVTYTVTITNTSPADSVTIDTITDSVGGGAAAAVDGTCDDLIGTTLAPGASTTCTFTMTVSGNAGDVVADTVTVTGTDDDDAPVSAQGSETVDLTDVASSLSVTKVADVESVPEPGGAVTYTVTIANTSTTDAVTIDSIADAVDGGTGTPVAGTCDDLIGTQLAPGASTTCTFTAQVTGNAGDATTDVVTVSGTDDDGTPVSATGSDVVDVTDVLPTGTVTKTADVASLPETGGAVTYQVSVTNTSTAESATVTAIADSVGGTPVDVTTVGGAVTSTTCATGAVLDPGETYTCAFTMAVPAGQAGDVITDEVTVTLADDEGNTTEPSDTEEVPLTDVAPTITVDKDNGDASVKAPGAPVTFDVTVTNTSAEPVTLTSLTDSIDGAEAIDVTAVADPITETDCATGGTIAAGGTYTCSFTAKVESDEAASIPDEVLATAVDDDGSQVTASDGAVTTVTAVADLKVEKKLVGTGLKGGESGSYEVVVTNLGPSTAAAPVVVDTLPAGLTATSASGTGWTCTIDGQKVTCTRSAMAPDESSTITVAVAVSKDIATGTVTNVVDVNSNTEDSDKSNNHDEVDSPVTAVAPEQQENVPEGNLPRTGIQAGELARWGVVLISLGTGLVILRRRRLRHS
jgi:uncharacterized repeat protein (TIGR01451 family)